MTARADYWIAVVFHRPEAVRALGWLAVLAAVYAWLALNAYPNPSDTLPSVGISSPGSSTGTLM
jgi:hypothetical protein